MKPRRLSGTAGPPSFPPELSSCRMVRRDSGKQSRSAIRMDTLSRSWSDNLSQIYNTKENQNEATQPRIACFCRAGAAGHGQLFRRQDGHAHLVTVPGPE